MAIEPTMPAEVKPLPTNPAAMVSHPDEVVGLIQMAAKAVPPGD